MAKPTPITNLDANSPLTDAAVRILTARLSDVRQYEQALAERITPDGVHDMRVATRRLRAALALFERRRQLCAAHDTVEKLGEALGAVRELHVQQRWLGMAAERAGDDERPGIQALAEQRKKKLEPRLPGLQAALEKWTTDTAEVLAAITTLDVRGRLGGHRVRKRLRRRLKDVARRMAAVRKSDDAHTAHSLRIGVKKLRYDLELAEPAFPEPVKAMLARLEPLQELLGDLHDADVHLPVVEKFVARADAATQPGGLRLLRDEIDLRERLAASLDEEVTRFTDEKILEQLRDDLC
jgi:CHAD domain-containing protein